MSKKIFTSTVFDPKLELSNITMLSFLGLVIIMIVGWKTYMFIITNIDANKIVIKP